MNIVYFCSLMFFLKVYCQKVRKVLIHNGRICFITFNLFFFYEWIGVMFIKKIILHI